MKRIRIDNSKEQLVLTGLIVSTRFIKDVKPILNLRLFKSDYSRTIARWCLKHFEETGKAPNVHIQDIFEENAEDINSTEEFDGIASVLDQVSTEFERSKKFNIDYVLSVAEAFFNSSYIENHCKLVLDVLKYDPHKAALMMEKFRNIKIPEIEGYSPLTDKRLIKRSFSSRQDPIFKMPGALGKMINQDLVRESFIGLLAAEKIGKTWNLLEFAIQAARQRCNVAFFQAGDMTDYQQTARIGIRLSGRSDKAKYCGNILIPILDCAKNQSNNCKLNKRVCKFGLGFTNNKERIETLGNRQSQREFFEEMEGDGYKACAVCKNEPYFIGAVWYKVREKVPPLTWKQAYEATKHFYKTRMKGRDFKLHSSAGDLTVDKIESILEHWERTEGFVADVIITDYADLFVNTANDFRHGTNEIWKDHRFLAQRRNCLVITATQADAEAYGKKKLDLKNFSEDKRKYAHVTAFYALSQTFEEKIMGITRLSHLVVREDDFDSRKEVKILRNLSIGRPYLTSYF